MKKLEITNKLTRTLNGVKFSVMKHSPEILVVTGLVGTVAATVMACKASTKISDIVDDAKEQLDIAHDCLEEGEINTAEGLVPYTEDDLKKDTTIIYAKTALKVAKLYAPAVIIGGLSITSVLTGHNILRKRNIALAAAYTAVDKGFKDYRGRVVERLGADMDQELMYNMKAKEVEEIVTNEKGKEKVVKTTVQELDPHAIGAFDRFFDEGSVYFVKDADANATFVINQTRFINEKLKVEKFLTVNDIYSAFGLDKTKEGHVLAFKYQEGRYLDFGLTDQTNERTRMFVNRAERSYLLKIQPDGYIYDLIKE